MPTISVSVQAEFRDPASWTALARGCEEAGFDALLLPDHPGVVASPFVALAAAAAVTDRIGLGTYVSHAGVREPLLLAGDVATLDVVSGGRARLALGAGHTPAEWEMLGSVRPDVAGRVRRFITVAEACRALLAQGDGEAEVRRDSADGTVGTGGPDGLTYTARLEQPRPVQRSVPFTFGGGNSTLLRWAGAHADVVGLSGLGRTLADGHGHEVRWETADIDRQVGLVEQGAAAAGRGDVPVREAFVQRVEITDDAQAVAHRLGGELGCSEETVLGSPYVWIGTEDEILSALARHAERWGITRYVVRAPAVDAAAGLLARLRDGKRDGDGDRDGDRDGA